MAVWRSLIGRGSRIAGGKETDSKEREGRRVFQAVKLEMNTKSTCVSALGSHCQERERELQTSESNTYTFLDPRAQLALGSSASNREEALEKSRLSRRMNARHGCVLALHERKQRVKACERKGSSAPAVVSCVKNASSRSAAALFKDAAPSGRCKSESCCVLCAAMACPCCVAWHPCACLWFGAKLQPFSLRCLQTETGLASHPSRTAASAIASDLCFSFCLYLHLASFRYAPPSLFFIPCLSFPILRARRDCQLASTPGKTRSLLPRIPSPFFCESRLLRFIRRALDGVGAFSSLSRSASYPGGPCLRNHNCPATSSGSVLYKRSQLPQAEVTQASSRYS